MSPPLKKILFVEDEPDIQVIARFALKTLGGFEVEVCSSGVEALSKIADFNPDLILLDVMMPDMDGPTTLKALQKTPGIPQIPVIFVTAKDRPEEVKEYMKLGALDVISKPFNPLTLSSAVKDIWSKRNA